MKDDKGLGPIRGPEFKNLGSLHGRPRKKDCSIFVKTVPSFVKRPLWSSM